MPIAAVDEDGESFCWKDDVDGAREPWHDAEVFAKAKAARVQRRAQSEFRRGVAGTVGLHASAHSERGGPRAARHRRHRSRSYRRSKTIDALVYACRLTIVSRTVAVDDLIDTAHVAAVVGLTHRNSVATYMRRYRDFPRPLFETEGGQCRLWSRTDVESWLASRRTAGKVRRK
jgi:hypothetical protein